MFPSKNLYLRAMWNKACVLFFIIGLNWTILEAQVSPATQLTYADSLFDASKYTESFEIYDHLLEVENLSSPAMLLRMAFIKEGLSDFGGALYYLNKYYLKTADKRVLTKMEDIAANQGLKGYEFGDFDFVITHFYKYFDSITYGLLALATLLLALVYHQKVRLKQPPTLPAITMIFVLTILFYTLNFGKDYNRAIIIDANAYLMSGPSAGAEVIEVVGQGHRVSYMHEKDVWVKVGWEDKTAFIKKDKLRFITF